MRFLVGAAAFVAAATALKDRQKQAPRIYDLEEVFGIPSLSLPNLNTNSTPVDPDCPPCFNCAAQGFECTHFGGCDEFTGLCNCPTGFGGPNCSEPQCGSLPRGSRRPTRVGNGSCECDEGWEGVNCNMCNSNAACSAFVPPGESGICYNGGQLVGQNWHMCNVTNRKILDVLAGRVAEVTFGCDRNSSSCDLQLWVDQQESFYCRFDECEFNGLEYTCPNIECQCVPDRLLCGADGSIDISEWLVRSVNGPGSLNCKSTPGDQPGAMFCTFQEPAMNQLIQYVFGDHSIELNCLSSECLHYSQVPGWEPPSNDGPGGVAALTTLVAVLAALGGLLWAVQQLFRQTNAPSKPVLPTDTAIRDVDPVALAFRGIGYVTADGKPILDNVTGTLPPGHVLAIMGGSGAGKTTLLDILGAKAKRGTVNGSVLLNGVPLDADSPLKRLVGFVDQQDNTLIPTLTVYEHVLFSALLRLPRSMSPAAKEMRALDTLQELGILHLQHQLVGSGLSGGERRRVAIACELVTSPSVLLLDEPTSGLDSFSAYAVMECLVNLAKNSGRTVVFTIHQPRSNIVELFDRILVIARGRLVFTGTPERAAEHFAALGHPVPSGYNLADFVVDLTMKAAGQQQEYPVAAPDPQVSESEAAEVLSQTSQDSGISSPGSGGVTSEVCADPEIHTMPLTDDPAREWEDYAHHRQQISRSAAQAMANSTLSLGLGGLDALVAAFTPDPTEGALTVPQGSHTPSPEIVEAATLWTQFRLLAIRTFRNLYRDPMLVLTHYGLSVGLGLSCGGLYFRLAHDISGFQNRLGLFFFLLAVFGFSTLTSLSLFSRERLVFMRERANGYYHPVAYYAAKVLLDIVPLRIGPPLVLGAIVYPLVGLNLNDGAPIKFLAVLVLFNLSAATIMLLIGTLIADYGVAVLVGCMVNLFGILFAGLFLNQTSMPRGTAWLRNLSIFHFAYEALSVNEVRYLDLTEYKFGLQIQVPGATILSAFGFNNEAVPRDIVGLGVISVACILLGYVALNKVLVERR